jgi:hypothetical protein
MSEQQLDEFDSLLSLVITHYHLYSSIPSAEKAEELYGVPQIYIENAFKDETFCNTLTEAGIVLEHFDAALGWKGNVLTETQLAVANQVLDSQDLRTNKKKLQDLGVSNNTYQAWLKDPVFQAYLKQRAEDMLKDNEHEVNLAFLAKIQAGDLSAVKFYKELTGEYVPQRAGNNQIDTHSIIVSIIEIIDEEVTDRDTQLRIAERIKSLISAQSIAAALVGGSPVGVEISQPEVVPTRRIEL